jgi:hypothetical protein
MSESTLINLNRIDANKWSQIWLEKLDREMKKLQVPPETMVSFHTVCKKFLSTNLGNPRTIALDKLCAFVNAQKTDVTSALLFFYTNISFSQEHQDMCRLCAQDRAAQKTAPPEKAKAKPKKKQHTEKNTLTHT